MLRREPRGGDNHYDTRRMKAARQGAKCEDYEEAKSSEVIWEHRKEAGTQSKLERHKARLGCRGVRWLGLLQDIVRSLNFLLSCWEIYTARKRCILIYILKRSFRPVCGKGLTGRWANENEQNKQTYPLATVVIQSKDEDSFGPWQVAQVGIALSWCQGSCLIPGQGTYGNQPMNA